MNENVFSGKTNVSFTSLIDLASENCGGKVLYASDDFFAPKENLIKASTPIFIDGKFTEFGKWMDGWESRRKRTPGHDHCILKLGIPGEIQGIDIDTAFFTGNHPEYASIEGIEAKDTLSASELEKSSEWFEILPKASLQGGSHNYFSLTQKKRVTHVRFHIYPDGGVARLHLYGTPKPNAEFLKGVIDLGAAANGARVVACSDQFFGPRDNLILPGRAQTMGDGWETKRRRGPGYDWIVIQLAGPGKIQKLEIDTNHFKGNYPDTCSVEVCDLKMNQALGCDFRDQKIEWKEILPQTKLQAHTQHYFEKELSSDAKKITTTFVKLNIYPDGGISRFRIYGELK